MTASASGASGEPAHLRPGTLIGEQDDRYEIKEELGRGSAARVYACQRLRTGEQFAVKAIDLRYLRLSGEFEDSMENLQREIRILKELSHDRIVNLHSVFQTADWCYLITELVGGGELFDLICSLSAKGQALSEAEAKHIFGQLLEGVGYMHANNVIHRDLKPENVLIKCSEPLPSASDGQRHWVKICDFGLSKISKDGALTAKTVVGTPQYWAPEILDAERDGSSYGKAVDFWSLGVILFVLLSGKYPFDGKRMPVEKQIRKGVYDFTSAAWEGVSKDATDLIRNLLNVSPQQRYSLQDCLRHPWLAALEITSDSSETECLAADSDQRDQDATVACDTPLPSFDSESGTGNGSGKSRSSAIDTDGEPSGEAGVLSELSEVDKQASTPPSADEFTKQADEHTFCFDDLLALQNALSVSLESASTGGRRGTTSIGKDHWAVVQARRLFQQTSSVTSRYAGIAQDIGDTVLPDIALAAPEGLQDVCVDLLNEIPHPVAEMRKDAQDFRRQYRELQSVVLELMSSAHALKTSSKQCMAGAFHSGRALPPCSVDITHAGRGLDDATQVTAASPFCGPISLSASTCLVPFGKAARANNELGERSFDCVLEDYARANDILGKCDEFWADVDNTLERLIHMKKHIERIIRFASGSQRLRQRFATRLEDYQQFWKILERHCSQYCSEYKASSKIPQFAQKPEMTTYCAEARFCATPEIVAAKLKLACDLDLGKCHEPCLATMHCFLAPHCGPAGAA